MFRGVSPEGDELLPAALVKRVVRR